jgi:MEDS: MEthanogen/methylotroph, DcmR Sensory domain
MTIHDPWRGLIADPMPRDHFVQVYRDKRVLIDAIALFAGAALGRNEAVILVATGEHCTAVERNLASDGFDVPALKAWGQLTVHDAEEVLSGFMVEGVPDETRFKKLVGEMIASVRASHRFRDVRVYGEMVNLLWNDNLPAATRLEELWNDVIEAESISLFCAYCLDGDGRSPRSLPQGLRALHTHFIPYES